MAMRSTGSATVSFGLVAVPVKLYTATETKNGISFNQLCPCGSRLKQQHICLKDGQVVERVDMLKGYEYEKSRYVAFTAEEVKRLEEQATQCIEIAEFLPAGAVNPLYYDKPYFLGPDKGGAKAYTLLAAAMIRANCEAVAKYAVRGKSYLVLLRAVAPEGLVMHQLLYADEVRSIKDVPLDHVEVREAEMKLAATLIESLFTDRFVPEKYEDTGKVKMLAAIQQKIDGGEITAPVEEKGSPVLDLMAALAASVKKAS